MTDEEILAACARVVTRAGVYRFTLADVAREVGVTASAISQRFGSKRELLLALVRASAADARATFAEARAGSRSPRAALLDALAANAADFRSRDDVARGLAFLELDLRDPEFRRATSAYFAAFRAEVEALVREAIARGELACARPADLARAVEVAYHGSLVAWALREGGTAAESVREDAARALAPYRARRGRAKDV